ncbi:MAG: hypothetical protein PHC66_01060 [Candidatus Nanoarchaeia archaeon]|nr:hypothetical protein [Candidatus Nanoarchaeia archaeon]MDD5239084.1 hypothetical protein [Candidatus Nanoarchaeia archaeon]
MPIVNITLRETKAVRNIIKADIIKPSARSNDIKIDDVRELKSFGRENNGVIIDFVYAVKYELKEPKDQNLGEILVKGEIVYVNTKDEISKVVDEWKKNKKLEPKLMVGILNAAMNKSQIEAIEQAAKVGLPSPIPLPSLKPEKQGKSSAS